MLSQQEKRGFLLLFTFQLNSHNLPPASANFYIKIPSKLLICSELFSHALFLKESQTIAARYIAVDHLSVSSMTLKSQGFPLLNLVGLVLSSLPKVFNFIDG